MDSGTQAPASYGSSSQPVALFFHYIFKVAALAYFWTAHWVWNSNFVLICVVTMTLSAADFWTVKNVTGRLLVGLRWWNDGGTENSGGESTWRFETLEEGQRQVNPADMRMFWLGQIGAAVAWLVTLILFLLSPYVVVTVVGLLMTLANLYGFFRCQRHAKQKLREFTSNMITGALNSTMQAALNRV